MLHVPPRQNDEVGAEQRAELPRRRQTLRAWGGGLRAAAALLWRRRLGVAALLGILGALWYFGAPVVLGPVVDADTVVRADFVQSVVASGHVEAPFRVNIGSQITGIVADVPVAEGQAVKAGDTLDRARRPRGTGGRRPGARAPWPRPRRACARLRELTLPSAEEALTQAQATLVNAQQAYDRAATARQERRTARGRRSTTRPRRSTSRARRCEAPSFRSTPIGPAAATTSWRRRSSIRPAPASRRPSRG